MDLFAPVFPTRTICDKYNYFIFNRQSFSCFFQLFFYFFQVNHPSDIPPESPMLQVQGKTCIFFRAMKKSKTILVYPPFADPTQPYVSLPVLKSYMAYKGIDASILDINIRAFHYLFERERLEELY